MPIREVESRLTAVEAGLTFKHIKALNKHLSKAKTAAEKKLVEAAIDEAKGDWFRRVRPLLVNE